MQVERLNFASKMNESPIVCLETVVAHAAGAYLQTAVRNFPWLHVTCYLESRL